MMLIMWLSGVNPLLPLSALGKHFKSLINDNFFWKKDMPGEHSVSGTKKKDLLKILIMLDALLYFALKATTRYIDM